MIPNKASILVAPNGSGKSSFAFAFQWLNRQRLKLNEDDAYEGNTENKPKLIITTDENGNNSYKADENTNDVSKRFGVFVINNALKASTPGLRDGVQMGKARITIPDIELLGNKPQDVNIADDFADEYNAANLPKGLFPVINNLLSDNHFMAQCDYEQLKVTKRQIEKIKVQIESIKAYTGTIVDRHKNVETNNKDVLEKYLLYNMQKRYYILFVKMTQTSRFFLKQYE